MEESPQSQQQHHHHHHHHHRNNSSLDYHPTFYIYFVSPANPLNLYTPPPWRTNAPVTPLPSLRLATATSSPGIAMTAPAVHSRPSGFARSVATSAVTAATRRSHKQKRWLHILFQTLL